MSYVTTQRSRRGGQQELIARVERRMNIEHGEHTRDRIHKPMSNVRKSPCAIHNRASKLLNPVKSDGGSAHIQTKIALHSPLKTFDSRHGFGANHFLDDVMFQC